MTKAYNWNELDIDFQIPLGNGKFGTISGRLDMYDWKTKTIIDLKTTKDVYSQAEERTIPKKKIFYKFSVMELFFLILYQFRN